MQHSHPARTRLRTLARQPDSQINLAEAALCIAWEDQQANHVAASLRALDALADEAHDRLHGAHEPHAIVNALNRFLFSECGFHGNTSNYHQPENSFLDRVLTTRTGLPILLVIVYIEVGERLSLPIDGVALPGHFLARFRTGGEDIYVDPFNHGRRWSYAECLTQIVTFYGRSAPSLVEQIMATPSKHSILARLLRNLKNLYVERGDLHRALAAVDRVLLVAPDATADLRDRGLMRARLGQLHGALEDLDHYARRVPDAADLGAIRREAEALAKRAAAGN